MLTTSRIVPTLLSQNCCDNGITMPSLYLQTRGGTAYSTDWDFTRFVPDAIIINLGTNVSVSRRWRRPREAVGMRSDGRGLCRSARVGTRQHLQARIIREAAAAEAVEETTVAAAAAAENSARPSF